MSEHDHKGDGWTEYRLLVTAMLERHEDCLDELTRKFPEERERCAARINTAEGGLRDLIDAKFVQLGQMHARQIENAKDELKKETTEVQVASITGKWQFWVAIVIQVGTVAAAVIALLRTG